MDGDYDIVVLISGKSNLNEQPRELDQESVN